MKTEIDSSGELKLYRPAGILGQIAARTLQDVKKRQERRSAQQLKAISEKAILREEKRDFKAALFAPGLGLIAEFKPRSPSEGELRPAADLEKVLQSYAPFAAAFSILCNQPFFGGNLKLLQRARQNFKQPLLCKDFILTTYQLTEAKVMGADAVLLIASLLPTESLKHLLALTDELGMTALVEVHDQRELESALEIEATVIGVNSRNLQTLRIDSDKARQLLEKIPEDKIAVAESGIQCAEQVTALVGLADAVLIGSLLMKSADPAAIIRQLGWAPYKS